MRRMMKHAVWTSLLFFTFPLLRHAHAQAPYFGATPPGSTPAAFAPSKIPEGAWGITFSPDGMECFISRAVDPSTVVILTTRENQGAWPNLTTAFFSGASWDIEPHITPDGQRLFFGSTRPLGPEPDGVLHQWVVEKTETGWSGAEPMDPPLTTLPMMFPSVAANGNMYFTTTSDNFSTQAIALSRFVDGQYQEAVLLSDSVNFHYTAAHPFIAPDESYILFDVQSNQPANWYCDLFISFKKDDGTWTRARNMGSPVNTAFHEACPFVSRDGKYLFYTHINRVYWVDAGIIETLRPATGVGDQGKRVLAVMGLLPNYPNPFNASTTIGFFLPKQASVRLEVCNLFGSTVKVLKDGVMQAGEHAVVWDGTDGEARPVQSGVYLCRIQSKEFCQSMKITVLR
jgi:hypothetical protein